MKYWIANIDERNGEFEYEQTIIFTAATEAEAMFANGVRAPKYSKQSMVMTNKKFTEWAMKNNHLYTADKI